MPDRGRFSSGRRQARPGVGSSPARGARWGGCDFGRRRMSRWSWRRRFVEAAVVLAAVLAPVRFRACGPFFPNRLLGEGDGAVLSAPRADFIREIDRLKPPREASPSAAASKQRVEAETAQADQAELAQALEEAGVARERRVQLLAEHKLL